MLHDFLPRPDGDFSAWANHYCEAVRKWWDDQGLDPADLKPLETALARWNTEYPAHVAARALAEAAAAAKKAARYGVPGGPVALEPEARRIAAFVQTYPTTTDADRSTIGIRVRAQGGPPAPVPTTRPLARVAAGSRLTHTLRFSDESTPTRTRKPGGVMGAEVWVALTDPRSPPPPPGDSYRFIAVSPRGTLRTTFASEDAGKTACYALRWVSTRGDKGPWSEPATATIAA